jgi:hypothetical protein
MKTEHLVLPSKELIVLTANGTLDLDESKIMIDKLVSNPEYQSHYEILMDLRDTECELTIIEIYTLVSYMVWPDPALPTRRKIAVVVRSMQELDGAKFMELCANNRSLHIKAFSDLDESITWLDINTLDKNS